jgi:DNA replication protein DnaD
VNRGYIKIWRKIEDSGLLQLPNTLTLFMFIVLNAAHKQKKVGTPTGVITLERGQYISGRNDLARKLKSTAQSVRTSLHRLTELEILTIESTNRYSIYTIVNYSIYQDSNQQDNQQLNQQSTSSQPAVNH